MRGGLLTKSIQRLSIEHLWALAAIAGVFVFLNLNPIRPHDFWWHMAVGREIVDTGQIPTVDAYSQTLRSQPYASYNMFWLMEVFFYQVYSRGGAALIVFSHSLMVSAAYAILLYLGWKISGSWRMATLAMLFAAALGLNDWNVRPQAATFFIGAFYLLAIHKLRSGGKRGWLLTFPLGMLVWANSHGAFFIGLIFTGLWLGDEAWRGWRVGNAHGRWNGLLLPLVALLTTGLAMLLNPRGVDILIYLNGMLANSPVQNLVTEWAAPSFNTLGGALFLLGLLFSAAVLAISPKRPSFYELCTFLFFATLGLKTSRGIIWFGIAMAPILAVHFRALSTLVARPVGKDSITPLVARRMNALFAALILLLVMVTLPWFKQNLPLPQIKRGLISDETPVEATQFLLENRLPGPVFHHMAYGSYLIWVAQPDYPVFIDPRIELYPYDYWMDYVLINNAVEGWESKLDRYGIQTMILSKLEQHNLVTAGRNSSDWSIRFENDQTAIFVRDD